MERDKLERGKEEWFATEVSLPNWGLEPSRDCNHVSHSELERMFGKRQMQKGYFYPNAKSTRVRERIDQLFPAIYQCPNMPKTQCISESFARAIVSEVCHGHPMNWAQYAEERWRAKKSGKNKISTVIKYGVQVTKDSYYGLVKARFEADLAKSELQHSEVEADHSDRQIFISTLMSMPKNPAVGTKAKRIKESISRLQGKLQASETALNNIVDSGEYLIERRKEEDHIVNLKYRLKKKEIALIDTKGEISEAMEELKRLEAIMEDLQDKSDRLRDKLRKMADRIHIPFTLRASQDIQDLHSGRNSFQLTVKPCALCESNFPQMDILLASCQCPYHPWCLVMQCWLADQCAHRECCEKFSENWKKSLGLDKMPEYYIGPRQPKGKRKHLSSDIGGVNFSKRKRR